MRYNAAENHQYYNAKVLEKAGIGKILEQKDLTCDSLYETVKDMLYNRTDTKENLSEVLVNDVDTKIYDCIKNI